METAAPWVTTDSSILANEYAAYLGLGVYKEAIAVAVAVAGREQPVPG